MCTVMVYEKNGRHLFGRTLDYEYSFGEELLFVPRGYKTDKNGRNGRYAYLGIGSLRDNCALMYDGVNEKGLCVAGLLFPQCAEYACARSDATNIPSYAITGTLLSECSSRSEAWELLSNACITGEPFDTSIPPSPLHWIVSDKSGSFVIEATRDGLRLYESDVGILANSPEYGYHLTRLSDYSSLSSEVRENTLCPDTQLFDYSRGLSAYGLPGDYSSTSRFVRAVYLKNHTECKKGKNTLSLAFRIMDALSVPDGAVITDKGEGVLTFYTAIIDSEKRIYYFSTHENRRIRACRLSSFVGGGKIVRIPIYGSEDIEYLN